MADIFIAGLVGMIVFYLAILGLGVWASRGRKVGEEEAILAGRSIGNFLGVFTLTASFVGGAFINGTAEYIYAYGLVNTQAPWGYTLSLALGGLVFAKLMRSKEYVTLLDPFQQKYGPKMGGLLYIPALMGDTFWCGAVLASLGTTVSVIIGISKDIAIIASACIVVLYTLLGGLYSVAYTDVIQLIFIFFGLWLSVPFAMTNDAVTDISETSSSWVGVWPDNPGPWIDYVFLLVLGGIPWQTFIQRVLACKTANIARNMTLLSTIPIVVLAIPPILIGAVGSSTDWTKTGFYVPATNGSNVTSPTRPEALLILPMVLRYLTPNYISFFGLGALSAAVMSSADSGILGSASMFAHNIYRVILRPKATEREIIWVMRVAILIIGALGTIMALATESVYVLFYLCSDIAYVTLFPQLCCVLFFDKTNTYGSFVGFVVGVVLRILGGEPSLGIPVVIKYPYYDEVYGQQFPFRTLSMLCAFASILLVSYVLRFLFLKDILPRKLDFACCFRDYDLEKRESKMQMANPAFRTD